MYCSTLRIKQGAIQLTNVRYLALQHSTEGFLIACIPEYTHLSSTYVDAEQPPTLCVCLLSSVFGAAHLVTARQGACVGVTSCTIGMWCAAC